MDWQRNKSKNYYRMPVVKSLSPMNMLTTLKLDEEDLKHWEYSRFKEKGNCYFGKNEPGIGGRGKRLKNLRYQRIIACTRTCCMCRMETKVWNQKFDIGDIKVHIEQIGKKLILKNLYNGMVC